MSVAEVDSILDEYRNETTALFDKHRWATRPNSGVPPHRMCGATADQGGEENVMRMSFLVKTDNRWDEDAGHDDDMDSENRDTDDGMVHVTVWQWHLWW